MKINEVILRAELYKRKITQLQLCKLTGVCDRTINRICNGKECHESTAVKIAEALGMELDVIREVN